MTDLLTGALEAFPRLRTLVVGDVMLDRYLSGTSHRLCQEAPVPIVNVQRQIDSPGGAGNCAVNLAALGAQTAVVGVTGSDCEGDAIRSLLEESRVDVRHLLERPARQTLLKARVCCDNHQVVRFDQGSTAPVESAAEEAILEALDELYPQVDAVIVSDYGYGVLTPRVIEHLASLQRRHLKTLVVDAKDLTRYHRVGMTACKPNYRQTAELLSLAVTTSNGQRAQSLYGEGERLLTATGARIVAVTLDQDGALIFERAKPPYRTHTRSAPQTRAAGAGDTFACALALALASGSGTVAAAEIAQAAAAVVVSKEHTATCSLAELRERVSGESSGKSDLERLQQVLDEHRRNHRRIVLTNGCFDILHRGHITYLEQARQLGDVLVVGVNTDESIRRLKGPARPINTLGDRIGVLEGLASVDYVVPFAEGTPHRLIEAIRPDVFVKGGDYTRATLPEAELVERLGGTVKILPLVSDRSTSTIISRICRVYGASSDDACPPDGTDPLQPLVESGPQRVVRPA